MRGLRLAVAAAVAATLAGATAARPAATPGVTDAEILIGGTAPLTSDPSAAGFVRGAEAYLAYVNARGGVHGRTISVTFVDDGGDPALAAAAARRLVTEDGVFALFGSAGTAQALAIRDALAPLGVPQLFAAARSASLGAARSPWTIGFAPSYRGEGAAYGRYLRASLPAARVAVLYQDDADGRELLNGLRRGLGARAGQVAAAAYDPAASDPAAALSELRASGATALCVFVLGEEASAPLDAARWLGWRPRIVLAAGAEPARIPEGAVSAAWLKDPTAPAWATDPGIALLRKVLRTHAKGADPAAPGLVGGMAAAYTLVDTLDRAGRDPTRAAVIKAAASLREASNPFLLPGIAVRPTARSRIPIQAVQLRRRTHGRWLLFGGLVPAPG